MKQSGHMSSFLRQIRMLPLSWLNLSPGKRLLIVMLSYWLGGIFLWLFFPQTHVGAIMCLPLVSACWLFQYRGMLISLVLNVLIFRLGSHFLWQSILSDQAFRQPGIPGLPIWIGLGLVVCLLRTRVDHAHTDRQRDHEAEQEHLPVLQAEYDTTLVEMQQRKIDALKDQFLLNVSHELRTPLTMLGGSLELLYEQGEYVDPTWRAYLLKEALASQEDLVDLVNQMLNATTMASEIPLAKPKAICVHQVVQEVLACLAPEDGQAYTVCVHVPKEVTVWADPQLLHQVLQNLLSNVFKYVPTQTEICIEATQAAPSSPVCLSIQDAGPGIPAEELPLLFEKFVRLKRDVAGMIRGTGLGLYICKQLVEAMGGHIWVESSGRCGEGSRFCMTLPPFLSPSPL